MKDIMFIMSCGVVLRFKTINMLREDSMVQSEAGDEQLRYEDDS